MKAYPIRNAELFEPVVKEERTIINRIEKEQECNCNRPYEIELTEQEYIQTCNTEQLAEVFMRFMFDAKFKRKFVYGNFYDEFAKWLKQPHREENDK